MKCTPVKGAKTLEYVNSYDLSNVVMFALGVETKYIRSPQRASATVTLDTMLMDSDLCHLRALCIVRTIALKRFKALCEVEGHLKKSFSDLLHFPEFVTRTLQKHNSDVLTMTGPLPERMKLISKGINYLTSAVKRYIPMEEENPDYLLSIFDGLDYGGYDGLEYWYEYFVPKSSEYAYRVWYSGGYDTSVFNSDFTMMFSVYKHFRKTLPNPALYKSVRRKPSAKATYDTIQGSSAVLEFLKSSLAEQDDRRVALIDTQNMRAATVYEFFRWVQDEFPQAFEEIVLFVDGREYWNWNIAETILDTPVVRVKSERILDGKSTVDTTLTAYAVQLYYEMAPDAIYVFSGDCDFIPLTDILPDTQFCFCGMSGGVSNKSLQAIKNKNNAKYIVLDELLGCIKAKQGGRTDTVDEVMTRLNQEKLDISPLLEPVRSICNSLGKRSDNIIAVSLLNQAFSSCHVRVTVDGCLEFKPPWEHWDWREEGATQNG